jgi:hypothetical protein
MSLFKKGDFRMKFLNENIGKNIINKLNEDTRQDVYNMSITEMIKKYAELCESAGSSMSYLEVLEQLESYGCLNTGAFRSMLIDTIDYLNDESI